MVIRYLFNYLSKIRSLKALTYEIINLLSINRLNFRLRSIILFAMVLISSCAKDSEPSTLREYLENNYFSMQRVEHFEDDTKATLNTYLFKFDFSTSCVIKVVKTHTSSATTLDSENGCYYDGGPDCLFGEWTVIDFSPQSIKTIFNNDSVYPFLIEKNSNNMIIVRSVYDYRSVAGTLGTKVNEKEWNKKYGNNYCLD